MVKGLDIFREHFRKYADYYVLIGGTACDLAMSEAGLDFRVTKDLDIVLCVETLDKGFLKAFWSFIYDGQYQLKEKSTGRKQYYRFQKPGTEGYPFMLELFSRVPDALSLADTCYLTPIPTAEDVSSLSAILMSDEYYRFIHTGKKELDGLSYVGPEHLVPLKARAWLDLSDRRKYGDTVDSKSIKKHRNDVFRLYQVLNPDFDGEVPDSIKDDLRQFISCMEMEEINLNSLGLGSTDIESVRAGIQRIYNLD